jgi:hypothetical protein
MAIIPDQHASVKIALFALLQYAHQHQHSRLWIPTIALLLRKGGTAHG